MFSQQFNAQIFDLHGLFDCLDDAGAISRILAPLHQVFCHHLFGGLKFKNIC